LILHKPEDGKDEIRCTLRRIDDDQLGNPWRYEALSYAWGNEDATHEIKVANGLPSRKGQRPSYTDLWKLASKQRRHLSFYVKPNLFAALKRLRDSNRDIWLWVDAICMNQKNRVEKSLQLPKMLEIYSKASNVCVWIGDCEDDDAAQYCCESANLAMDFITKAIDLKLLDGLVAPSPSDDVTVRTLRSWVALANLLKRGWFSRRWVVQEVASARKVSVHCGRRAVSWVDFADAIDLFMAKVDRIRKMYEESSLWRERPDALKHVESLGAKAMVTSTNTVFRRSDDGEILERLMGIETLVMGLGTFEASDPRDIIYAVLAIAKDGPMGKPYPMFHRHNFSPRDTTPDNSPGKARNQTLGSSPRRQGATKRKTRASAPSGISHQAGAAEESMERQTKRVRVPSSLDSAVTESGECIHCVPSCTPSGRVDCLKPDYNKHPLDVYTDFVKYCVETTGRLDIICRQWALPIRRKFDTNLAGALVFSWTRPSDHHHNSPED
jgi:hypothetical protein